MDFVNVFSKLFQLFFILFLGFISTHLGWVKKESSKHFNNLLFYITTPALILYSLTNTDLEKKSVMLEILAVAALLYVIEIILGFVLPLLFSINKSVRGLYSFFLIFGNTAFIGLPVTASILGDGAVFYAVIYLVPFNLLAFSLGMYLITKDNRSEGHFHWKQIVNPSVVASVIGLVLFFSDVHFPSTINSLLNDLGSVTMQLSMFLIGISLYGIKIKGLLAKKRLFLISFLKLAVVPAFVALGMFLLKVEPIMATVAIIASGMPFGATTVILCQEYDINIEEASEGVLLSTLLMLLSLPLLVYLTGIFI